MSRARPLRRLIEAMKAAEPAKCKVCGKTYRAADMADWLTAAQVLQLPPGEIDKRIDKCKRCFRADPAPVQEERE